MYPVCSAIWSSTWMRLSSSLGRILHKGLRSINVRFPFLKMGIISELMISLTSTFFSPLVKAKISKKGTPHDLRHSEINWYTHLTPRPSHKTSEIQPSQLETQPTFPQSKPRPYRTRGMTEH
jgi:hypothetical protein